VRWAYSLFLALNHDTIGLALSDMRKPAEAMAAHKKALGIGQKLAEANTTDATVQNSLARTYNGIGEAYAQMGKPAEALKSHEQARALMVKLVEANHATPSLPVTTPLADCGQTLHSTRSGRARISRNWLRSWKRRLRSKRKSPSKTPLPK
jgi:tetratricopeptide (TPR) repeat protein